LSASLRSQFSATALGDLTFNKKLYGVPMDINNVAMIYNPKLVTSAPRTFADMVNPKEIPVPDHATDDIFLPLCERHLLRSPFWADDRRRGAVADAAALAERSLRLISPDPGLTNHSVGTPTNF
jgi:spermidine/putrescine-binding protein